MVRGVREKGGRVAVLPVGIVYHGREHARTPPRHPAVAAGPPILWEGPGAAPSIDEVRRAVRDGIGEALTRAWG